MPAITPALLGQCYQLTAGFYAAGIECPPLVAFNKWIGEHMTGSPSTAAQTAIANNAIGTRGKRSTGNATKTPSTYDAAVLTAVQSSPAGIGIDGLAPMLKSYGKPANQIGAALGRLTRAGKIEKKGELWYAALSATVDRTLVAGTRRRGRSAAANTSDNATGATEQPPMAATG